jgi:hypothetical protein
LADLSDTGVADLRGKKLDMIIGISGKRGVGKDTVAEILTREYGFKRLSFADPMKEVANMLFGFTEEQLWGPSEKREAIDPYWGFSPRRALQTMGTEWGRNCLDKDVWVKIGLQRAGRMIANGARGVVIPDVRFPNEANLIKQHKGYLLRIERPAVAHDDEASRHESETALDDYHRWTSVLRNEGSIEDLAQMVCGIIPMIETWATENT